MILLCLAGALSPGDFWRSWGELGVILSNDRLGGPFLPAFLAVLFAYAPWSRFRILRVLGALANFGAALVFLFISSMMALVSTFGGPDARAESMPPAYVPLLFLLLAAVSLASMASIVAAPILARRQRREPVKFPERMTRVEGIVILALLCLAAGGFVWREVNEKYREVQRRAFEAEERFERHKVEEDARRRAAEEAPGSEPAR